MGGEKVGGEGRRESRWGREGGWDGGREIWVG